MERFRYDQRKAYEERDCDYYTDAIDYTQVKVLEEFESIAQGRSAPRGALTATCGSTADRRLQEDQVLHDGNWAPETQYARARDAHHILLATFPGGLPGAFRRFHPTEKQSGINGLGNALRTVAALLLMRPPRSRRCVERRDCRGLEAFEPNLYLYDVSRRNWAECAALSPGSELPARPQVHTACACGLSVARPDGETGERGKLVATRTCRVDGSQTPPHLPGLELPGERGVASGGG
jgi:hypothetical protein